MTPPLSKSNFVQIDILSTSDWTVPLKNEKSQRITSSLESNSTTP